MLNSPGNPAIKFGPMFSHVRLPATVLLTTNAVGVGSPGSRIVMLVRLALPPMLLSRTPTQFAATWRTMRLPPIVFHLIGHGMYGSPPPLRMTLPSTVIPFSSTVSASVALIFPLTVIRDLAADGLPFEGSTHGCPVVWSGGFGRQPRPRSEPNAAETSPPTVSFDANVCASSTEPAVTFTLPTTSIAAPGGT